MFETTYTSEMSYRSASEINSAMGRVYGHMSLAVIVSMIVSYFVGTSPDLTEGFVKGLIKKDALKDDDFIFKELDVTTVRQNLEHRDRYKPVLPWAKRRRIYTGQVDK